MPVLHVEVIMRSKYITRNHRGERTAMLLRIAAVQYINHTFSVAVAKIAVMGRSEVHLENIGASNNYTYYVL